MKPCVIYCRVSSERQKKEGNGASSQRQRCEAFAGVRGYSVVRVFTDEGISGAVFDRPAILEMLTFLKQSKEEVVVLIDDISRIARDVSTHIQLRAAITSAGGMLESPSMKFEESAAGEFIELILAANAQFGRKGNREQVLNRQLARLQTGYWTFPTPLGYEYVKHPVHKKLAVPNARAAVLGTGLEMYSRGSFATKRELASYLQENEFFSDYKVQDIYTLEKRLTRVFDALDFYAGYVTYKPWGVARVKAQHTAIISEATLLRLEQRESGNGGLPIPRLQSREDFIFRNFIRCCHCNKPLTGSVANRRYPRYHCYNRYCDLYGHSIKPDSLTDHFLDLLGKLEASEDLIELMGITAEKAWQRRIGTWDDGKRNAEAKIVEYEDQIGNLIRRLGKTLDDSLAEELEKQVKALKNDVATQRLGLLSFSGEQPDFRSAYDSVSTLLKSPKSYWENGSDKEKRIVHRVAFSVPPAYSRETGFSTVDFTLPYQVSLAFKGSNCKMVEVAGADWYGFIDNVVDWSHRSN